MRLLVISHKPLWRSPASPSGYATDGGFPMQMEALSELFDEIRVAAPCVGNGPRDGEAPLRGRNLSVAPLTAPAGRGLLRKAGFPFWLARNAPRLLVEILRAGAVHTPVPGDVGTVGMLLAPLLRRRLFVRHCGNWFVRETRAQRFWPRWMERLGGARHVMLATGGHPQPPSRDNPSIGWIFSTSLRERELASGAPREAPPADPLKVVIACRQEPRKGTATVLEALPAIAAGRPGVHLDVVGDGSGLPSFRDLAARLGVASRVTFHGKVAHARVLEILRAGDLFVYPTRASEGFPKVVLEALAAGMPVLTTRVSVLPELIADGCGVLLDDDRPETLARAVLELVDEPARYRAMSHRAVETARRYSLERWRDEIGGRLREAWGPLRSDR